MDHAHGAGAGVIHRFSLPVQDAHIEVRLAGEAVQLLGKVLLVNVPGDALGGPFDSAGFDGLVEIIQEDHLEEPQQQHQHRHKGGEAGH